jgi:CRISPR/Cas system CSM-associated protein Csm3 (group 7 of RAMP superfamily)
MRSVALFVVELEGQDRFGVAAPERTTATPSVDRPLAASADGRPWVPPTSVAGALRQHLGTDADLLMGPMVDERRSSGRTLTASPLWVVGTELDATAVQVTRTSIDPRRGAARSGGMRSEQVLERGARVTVFLRLDDPGSGDLPAAAELAGRLGEWAPMLGSGRTSGRGQMLVRSVRFGTLDLADSQDATTWLAGGGPDLWQRVAIESADVAGRAPASPAREYLFSVVDGLRTESQLSGNKSTLVADGDELVWMRGTSVRGIFRQRASFILRTLGHDVCTGTSGCGECLVCETFGSTSRRGVLRFPDVQVVDAAQVTRPHVAIDRFAGGATGGHLFTEEVLVKGRVAVRAESVGAWPDWLGPLLDAVAVDIHQGFVGLGGGSGRGIGTVQLSEEIDTGSVYAQLRSSLSLAQEGSPA